MKKKILFGICLTVFLCAVGYILYYEISQRTKGDVYEKLAAEYTVTEAPTASAETEQPVATEEAERPKVENPIDFQQLQEENADIYAWLRIPGTKIDYPIVQRPSDDFYYLNHTVAGAEGLPGSIYTESLNRQDFSDRNTVIYGHNMKNGTMFGKLRNYKDRAFMEEHREIIIYLPGRMLTYQVFAAVTYDSRHLLNSFDFSSDEGMQAFLDSLSGVRNMASYMDSSIAVDKSSKLVTLSTCNGNSEERLLVEAVLIDERQTLE